MKPALRAGLRFAVGAGLLGLILSRVELSALRVADPLRVALAVGGAALLLFIGQSFAALRWKLLLGPGSPPWTYLVRLYVIGLFFSLFLPTVVGGDAVRAVAASQATSRPGSTVASVLLDRAFGMLALLLYGVIGVALSPSAAAEMLAGSELRVPGPVVRIGLPLLLLGGAVLVWRLRRSERFRLLLADGLAALRRVAAEPRVAAQALGLGFVVQGLYLLLWIVLAEGMGFDLPLLTFLVAVPLVTLGTMLPVSLAGLGLREGAWLLLLRHAGIAPANIVAFSLLFFATTLLLGSVGGVVFMVKGTGHRQ